MKVKEESEKVGWKLNIQKTKIMASGPITSWQIDRETIETVTDYLGGSKITADMQIKMLAPWPAYRYLRRQVRWSGIPTC